MVDPVWRHRQAPVFCGVQQLGGPLLPQGSGQQVSSPQELLDDFETWCSNNTSCSKAKSTLNNLSSAPGNIHLINKTRRTSRSQLWPAKPGGRALSSLLGWMSNPKFAGDPFVGRICISWKNVPQKRQNRCSVKTDHLDRTWTFQTSVWLGLLHFVATSCYFVPSSWIINMGAHRLWRTWFRSRCSSDKEGQKSSQNDNGGKGPGLGCFWANAALSLPCSFLGLETPEPG